MDALEGFLPVEQSEVNLHEPSYDNKKVTFRQFLSDAFLNGCALSGCPQLS